MAISNAWLKSTRGRLAGVTIWNDRQGRTLMREIVTPRNPQTPAQQEQRRLMTTVQTAYAV